MLHGDSTSFILGNGDAFVIIEPGKLTKVMTPIVRHGRYATQLNITPIYENTEITLVRHSSNAIVLIENHQLIAVINAPIMKIVRGIRQMFPKAKMNVV